MSSDIYWLKTDLLENVFDSYVDFLTEFYRFYGRIWTLSMCCDVVEYLSLYIYNTTVDKETKTAADGVLIKTVLSGGFSHIFLPRLFFLYSGIKVKNKSVK